MGFKRATHRPHFATGRPALRSLAMRGLLRGRSVWPLLLLAALAVAGLPVAQATSTPTLGPRTAALIGAWGWGANNTGQLGNGTTSQPNPIPGAVSSISNVVALATGADPNTNNSDHSLAVTADGTVWTWGDNRSDELGNGTSPTTLKFVGCIANCSSTTPVHVTINLPAVATTPISGAIIAAGGSHDLVLAADGSVWAWGDNSHGQLGNNVSCNGSCAPDNVPSRVVFPALPAGVRLTAVAAGSTHSLALAADGTVWAWGDNSHGQLASTLATANAAQLVSGLPPIVAIAAGGDVSLALTADGHIWAWGDNTYGQLGTIQNTNLFSNDNNVPLQVADQTGTPLGGFTAIAEGGEHTLALRSDGSVWAWGWNASGQLGSAQIVCPTLPVVGNQPCSPWPVQVPGLSGVSAIAAGNGHSVALLPSGAVEAWGDNTYGQLGNGTSGNSNYVPQPLVGLSGISGIAAGGSASLALAPAPTVSVSPSSLNFGSVVVGQTSGAQDALITNTGATTVTISKVTLTQPSTYIGIGTPPFGGNPQACQGIALGPGQSCAVSLTYTPAGVGTSTGGSLSFTDNAAGSPQVVSLGGSGIATAPTNTPVPSSLTVPPSVNFGNVVTGTTSAPQPITVLDNGPGAVTIGQVTVNNPLGFLGFNAFALYGSGNCTGVVLQMNQSCTIYVTYTPAGTGASISGSSVQIPSNASGSPQSVLLYGTGVLPPTATATPTRTPIPTATITPTATFTPSPTPTRGATTATSTPHPTTPTPKPTQHSSGGSHGKPPTKKPSAPSLSIKLSPSRVASGSILKILIHTAARAQVDGTLQVTQSKTTYTGSGKKRKKVVHTTVLARVKIGGHADTHGNLTTLVRVAYNPPKPIPANLTVTVRTSAGKTTHSVTATILPKPKPTAHTTSKTKPKPKK